MVIKGECPGDSGELSESDLGRKSELNEADCTVCL